MFASRPERLALIASFPILTRFEKIYIDKHQARGKFTLSNRSGSGANAYPGSFFPLSDLAAASIPLALALVWLALSPMARAVDPPPDGGYPGFDTAEGTFALFELTDGVNNTAIDFSALADSTTGNNNTAIEVSALLNNTGSSNNGLRYNAGLNRTTPSNNIKGQRGSRSFMIHSLTPLPLRYYQDTSSAFEARYCRE